MDRTPPGAGRSTPPEGAGAAGPRRALRVAPHTPPATPLPWPAVGEGPAPGAALRHRPAEGGAAPGRPRLLVGGVGYRNLRDYSLGPALVDRLQGRAWPPGVVVEDLSVGPIDVLFRLQAEPAPFAAGLFVGSVRRGRPPGTVEARRWRAASPAVEELQARIAEAVTGVISLENLLLILQHFGALPAQTLVVEIEPADEGWGEGFSPAGQAALAEAEAIVSAAIAAFVEGRG